MSKRGEKNLPFSFYSIMFGIRPPSKEKESENINKTNCFENKIKKITRNEIKELLKYKNNPDLDSKLYKIEDLNLSYNVQYKIPTLVKRIHHRPSIFKNNDEFKNRFYQCLPCLKYINFNNLFIIGGSISNILVENTIGVNQDIDIFIYGLNEEETIRKIKNTYMKIIQAYHNFAKKNGRKLEYHQIKAYMNKYTLTFYVKSNIFQIIFKKYKTKKEILDSSDLGSSMVGFDGENVLFNKMGKYCYENLCNILPSWCAGTLKNNMLEMPTIKRIFKYFERGYDVILPNFNISNVETKNDERKPTLNNVEFYYRKIIDQCLNKTNGLNNVDISSVKINYNQSEKLSDINNGVYACITDCDFEGNLFTYRGSIGSQYYFIKKGRYDLLHIFVESNQNPLDIFNFNKFMENLERTTYHLEKENNMINEVIKKYKELYGKQQFGQIDLSEDKYPDTETMSLKEFYGEHFINNHYNLKLVMNHFKKNTKMRNLIDEKNIFDLIYGYFKAF